MNSALRLAGVAAAAAAVLAPAAVFARGQAPGGEIRVGMSTALSGPARALGRGMLRGVEAYLRQLNEDGGVFGRELRVIALDDAYQPGPVAANMFTLIEEHDVLAVVGNVGTPTATEAVPIAIERQTLFFGAFTGASLLRRTPNDRYVVNFRASYEEETAAMVRGLLRRGVQPREIAFFTQDDAYGDSGYEGAVRALEAAGYHDARRLAHGRYPRNTLNVEDGLITVFEADVTPRAIIMVGAYAPSAKFIRLARRVLPGVLFLNVSFVGSDALAVALGIEGDGVIVTQVVPHFDSDLPGVAEYRRALGRYFPDAAPDFVSLEGFLAAKTFVAGLRRAGPDPTRESVIDAIDGLRGLDIGIGVTIDYSPADHQGSDRVWPTMIDGGRVVPIEW